MPHFFQKIIAWFLIGLLFFEATFRIPFLVPSVEALEAQNHEDVVSLLVEEQLFKKISSDIDTYARRIQAQLPHTRTVIMTYAADAHPFLIASANERLYFSGLPNHGNKTQKLVGTILIGHVPLPVVHKDGKDFLSMYPYTDFSDPHFFWNWNTNRYEYIGTKPDDTRPDIWHSVIDPNSGNLDTDVTRIKDFFARVYEYDSQKGRYQNVGKDPQVLYMDSLAESRAVSKGLLGVYEKLHVPQQENLLYHRYTAKFAQYFYDTYLALMNSEGTSTVVPFSAWKPDTKSTATFLKTAGDITTKVFADELVVPFLKVINEKYIGDVSRWVHNTGRYYNGYSDVRVDTIPEVISKKDELTGQILKELNTTLEKIIDTYVDENMSLDIPLLINRGGTKTISEKQTYSSGGPTLTRIVNRPFDYMYDNFIYGKKASDIKEASECSLIRGSTFGADTTRVEMNHGYSMTDAKTDGEKLTQDTKAGIICKKPTQSYWGGNSPINAEYKNGEITLGEHRYDDFSQPILDLSGGKKTTSLVGNALDCMKRDTLLRPYVYNSIDGKTVYPWPVETSGKRYSCATDFNNTTPYPINLDPSPEGSENILTNLVSCPPAPKSITTVSLLDRKGGAMTTCQTNGLTGTYKRLSSLIKHADPDSDIYGQQLKGISSPNLPIDEERYLSYIDRDAREAKIAYPNLFDINVTPEDTDDAIIAKITASLSTINNSLKPGKTFPDSHPWRFLVGGANSAPKLVDSLLANTDIKAALIEALRWRGLDSEAKYAHAFDVTLDTPKTLSKLLVPEKKDTYEISYLGGQGDARNFVFGFSPESKTALPEWFTKIQSLQDSYNPDSSSIDLGGDSEFTLSPAEIAGLLGGSSEGSQDDSSSTDATTDGGEGTFECGDPEGVVIWEWLSAIQCWLSNLFKTEWTTPSIDDIGFPEPPSITFSVNGQAVWSTKEIADVDLSDKDNNRVLDYVEKNASSLSLTNTLQETIIEKNETVRIDAALETSKNLINDDTSQVALVVTQIDDLDSRKSYKIGDKDWDTLRDSYVLVSGSPTLKDGHVTWTLQAKNNHRARVYIESRIYSGDKVFLRSEKSIILVGPTKIPLTVLSTDGSSTTQTLQAGDAQGIRVILGETEPVITRATIGIYDYVTGKKYFSFKDVPVQNNRLQISASSLGDFLKKSGRYTLDIESGELAGETRFTISPSSPHHIVTDVSTLLLKDKKQSLKLSIQDVYNNDLTLDNWSFEITTSEPLVLDDIGEKEGTQFAGKLKSNSLSFTPKKTGNITFSITLTQDKNILKATISRPVLSDIKLVTRIDKRDTIEVGQDVVVNFSVERADGTVVDIWDMPITVGVRGGNAKIKSSKLIFEKGRASTILSTGTKAAELQLYMSDTVLGSFIGDTVLVHPAEPFQLSLSGPEILFAKKGSTDTVTFELRDKFGNLTSLRDYSFFQEVDNPSALEPLILPQKKSLGIYTAPITSRGYATRVLLHVWLNQGGKKSPTPTLENVLQLSILPVITSDDAAKNSWTNITQIMLGSVFGQTPIQGYFAGSALFAPNTQTLAISTLVDQPKNSVFTINPTGNVSTGAIKYGTGMSARIENIQKNISVIIQDSRLGDLAKIVYPSFGADVSYGLCPQAENDPLCDRDTIAFVPANTSVTYKDESVYQNNQKLFSLRDIFSFPNLEFRFINQDGYSLQFAVYNGSTLLGILALRWKSRVPDIGNIREDSYKIQILKSGLDIKLNWSQTSSHENPSALIYSRDDTTSYIGGANESGWSQYGKEEGLGWTGDNVSLLQFASGQNWSESQKDTSDYLTINLGDPLIHLPEYRINAVTGFDQTIGEPVYYAPDPVDALTFRDVNSDGNKDLIALHNDGTIGTRLSRGDGTLLDVGDLLSVPNAQDDMVRAGDFSGDGFADIVYADNDGMLHLVVHDASGNKEVPLLYDKKPVLGKVMQLEVFDMDHDALDDIIIMDSLGGLYIFYGSKTGIFTVHFIENAYDFSLGTEPKTTYFTGAIRYDGIGYRDPAKITKSTKAETLSKQTLIEQSLFLNVSLPKTEKSTTSTPVETLGTTVYDALNSDADGFLRGYDGDAGALAQSLKTGFDALQNNNSTSIKVLGGSSDYDIFPLLKAPFISQKNILITKKYASLEAGNTLVAGSPVEATLELKNLSGASLSNIILLEQFASFMQIDDAAYDMTLNGVKTVGTFIDNGDSGIVDLRNMTLKPRQSLIITYRGSLRSFSFGRFDVGYLEDKNDPNTGVSIPAASVKTLNTQASQLASIPERDFYNHDVYGDIRFNPNETCGGPILLWRSHNTFDRTYYKTLIVRDIQDPDANAVKASESPTSLASNGSQGGSTSSSTSTTPSASDLQKAAESDLATWQADSDGDDIPDRGDDDHGDVFEIKSSGNSSQISIGLGKVDSMLDDIIKGVTTFLSGLSCGFGDPGCISMPINWAANIPGNTITFLGFSLPGVNQPPIACNDDVRCGYPIFSAPTISCAACEYECAEWPPCSEGAGGGFDYYGGSSPVSPPAGYYMPGLGISEFRIFIGATLTGAIAEVMCFGPNDAISNLPGMYPLRFDGNCIFATQPLTQCEDDGADEDPLLTEMDVSSELSTDNGDGSGTGNGNTFTDADSCGFYNPVSSYPKSLSDAASAYLADASTQNADSLHSAIADNTDLVIDSTNSTESGLYMTSGATDDTFARLNGVRGLKFNNSSSGTGMLQISLDGSKLNLKSFGKVLDINLRSIKGFPNFIIDWYHRQLDEIVSSLGHLPDIKIMLPDLTGLGDSGAIGSFVSGAKNMFNGNNNASPNATNAAQNTNTGDVSQQPYYNAQNLGNNCGPTSCSIAASKLTGVNAESMERSFTEQKPGAMNWDTPQQLLEPLGLNVEQRSTMSSGDIHSQIQQGNVVIASVGPKSGLTSGGHITTLVGSEQTSSGYTFTNADPNYRNIQNGNGTISDSQLQNGGAKQYWVVSSKSSSGNSTSSSSSGTSSGSSTTASSSSTSDKSFLSSAGSTIKNGWNGAFDGLQKGLDSVGGVIDSGLGYLDTAKNEAAGFVQDKTTGIKNAFEYLGTLPIIDVHPETINFEIPWVGKQEAQSWLIRNQAILDAWQNMPADAVNSVDIGTMVSSIQSNIEIVRSYLDLPEKLQNLFYIKEKLLYGIIQNVTAVQDLLGGWLYTNGLRFKAWVEVFILVTKLWDIWQILIDVFDDYEASCGVCRNERWNLQHWLWIIISMIIPPIPVIQMPRWPDIELDFSDIDLSLDIAYPVFNLSFYPINLPDAPVPSISGFPVGGMPLLPRLPNLDLNINIPVIRLPKLPDLPPPPKIPELSQAIQIVLKIFKIIVLIQCLYRKIPLSPEWFIGTKVAHKTERQGFLSFDFLDYRLPTVSTEWLDAIRVATHVKLQYNVEYITDMIRSALEPLTNFPRNLDEWSDTSGASQVKIDIKPDTGVKVDTTSSIQELPGLIAALYAPDIAPETTAPLAQEKLGSILQGLDIPADRRAQFAQVLSHTDSQALADTDPIQKNFQKRFGTLHDALALDVAENKRLIADLESWKKGAKKPEEIPLVAKALPNAVHLTSSPTPSSHFLALEPTVFNPLLQTLSQAVPNIVSPAPLAVAPVADTVAAPRTGNSFSDKAIDTSSLAKTRGLYVTNNKTSQRLIDYTENLDGKTVIYSIDDDHDGDQDVYYSLGKVVYRKENHQKKVNKYFITDAPRVYTTADIYSDFFGSKNQDITSLSGDAQVKLSRTNSYGRLSYQFLNRRADAHMRLFLFRSLFQRKPSEAAHVIDFVPKNSNPITEHTVIPVAHVITAEGRASIEHNVVYRILIAGKKFLDEAGKTQSLSDDFIIRSGQSGYARETTRIDITNNGKTITKNLRPGDRLIFAQDSSVNLRKGSLILLGSTTEKRNMTFQDNNYPLLPGDQISTGDTGKVTIVFPDGTRTEIGKNQHWVLSEYTAGVGIKTGSLTIEPNWYYGAMEDARSLSESRVPHQTLFDTYSRSSNGAIVSQIPREISLTLDKPTEVDFQKYFPADIITNVEVLKLASSEWRKINNTTLAFETQKVKKDILVRVTTDGFVRDYTTTLITQPPTLGIKNIDAAGLITGELSTPITLPIGIQSFIGNKSWTLNAAVSSQGTEFSTTIPRTTPTMSLTYNGLSVATIDRATGAMTLGGTLSSIIGLGKPLGYAISDTKGQKAQMTYLGKALTFSQVNSDSDIRNTGIYIMGAGIRLEPVTTNDKVIPAGAYITDTTYRPLIALDSDGIVRFLDTNITWTVSMSGSNIVFTMSQNKTELGKIILHGDMLTTWAGK